MEAGATIRAKVDQLVENQIQALAQAIMKGHSIESTIDEQSRTHKNIQDDVENKYLDQVLELTRDKGPDVQMLSKQTLKNLIQTIFDEGLIRWEDEQSIVVVADCLTKTQQTIKEKIYSKI